MEKEQVQFYGTLLGALASLSALSYIIWQHRKNQALFTKQDALLQHHTTKGKILNTLDGRLRNLELSQCSNPYVRQNPQLTNLLNCPQQRPSSPPPPPPPPPPQVVRPQRATISPPATAIPGGYAGRTNVAASQNLPPMPNYGFFGDGPAGLSSGSDTMMMGAFADDRFSGPVPFEK